VLEGDTLLSMASDFETTVGSIRRCALPPSAFFCILVTGPRRFLSLELIDTRVYEPQIRARVGTTRQCQMLYLLTCVYFLSHEVAMC